MRAVVVIPAYNEERTVGEVVRNVRAHVPDVIVVDDGSDDATGDRARHAGAMVITHCVNRGLGAALSTGIAAALRHRRLKRSEERATGKPPVSGSQHEATYPDVIVTLDADGQHDPADIAAVIAPIQAGFADLVIGTRFAARGKTPEVEEARRAGKTSGVEERAAPLPRRLANSIANLLTHLLFNVRCSDTQSGFRAFSRRAAERINIRTNYMEVSSEILAEAVRHGLRITEVPIRTIYTAYSLSKGQSFTVGLRTAWALILRRWF